MNRETYPASLFPLRGDVSAEAGATTVTVVGINGTPFGTIPALLLDGVGVSIDYFILCDVAPVINFGSDAFLGVRCNGTLVGN
ncbi:MAG: hypothetical protein C5B59_08625 [Bacteroidetes bacterium]|nr:MAG: hypothetical protein C5B59_08625 [Bacteroidota bacterium]